MELFTLSGVVAIAAMAWQVFRGPAREYVPGACPRLERHLGSHLAGQAPAVEAAADAVCAHLADTHPQRPLVLSVHGPPGVGKSYFHLLAAQALYNLTDGQYECPGYHCPAYKIVFGMDFLAGEAAEQHIMLRHTLLNHFHAYKEALVVVEEFDKASCESRQFLRHLLLHGDQNTTLGLSRSIVILESNTGYLDTVTQLQQAGDRSQVPLEAVTSALKDRMFVETMALDCLSHVEASRLVNLVDAFVPFFPLEHTHVVGMHLRRLTWQMQRAGRLGALLWGPEVVDFLAGKVYFEDGFAVEGASGVHMIVARYVTKALRRWDAGMFEAARVKPPRATQLELALAADGAALTAAERHLSLDS
eukprot:jgi/Tetstr1/424676/TSEL_015198.t1